jgi:hypothetical protein
MNRPVANHDPAHWQGRSDEARLEASQATDREVKTALLEIALGYEAIGTDRRQASTLEKRAPHQSERRPFAPPEASGRLPLRTPRRTGLARLRFRWFQWRRNHAAALCRLRPTSLKNSCVRDDNNSGLRAKRTSGDLSCAELKDRTSAQNLLEFGFHTDQHEVFFGRRLWVASKLNDTLQLFSWRI